MCSHRPPSESIREKHERQKWEQPMRSSRLNDEMMRQCEEDRKREHLKYMEHIRQKGKDPEVGDMVNCEMKAGIFTVRHRGIYVGYTAQGGQHSVVHNFCGEDDGLKQMKNGSGTGGVMIWSMAKFKEDSKNKHWWVDNEWSFRFGGPSPYTGEQIAQRALNRVGERDYRIKSNNCEHFAFWCRYNVAWSPQIEDSFLASNCAIL